jgi:DNA-directed RNA polymerase alpha subunit
VDAVQILERLDAIVGELRGIAGELHSFLDPSFWDHPRSIGQLELGTRSFNALYRADLKTVDQVAACTRHDLLKISNFGRRSLAEVEQALASFGLELAR